MDGATRGISVGVVDDHDLLIAGIRALLSTAGSPARFVAGANTVPGLLESGHRFDVVILDVRLDDGSIPEDNVRALAAVSEAVLLHADARHREAAPMLARSDAAGLLWKNDPARTLLEAVVTVAGGGRWTNGDETPPVQLSHRETEVLRLYAAGLKYAETAAALEPPVSVESVKTYLQRVRRRYVEAGRPASTRFELRQRALEDGLLPPELGNGHRPGWPPPVRVSGSR